MYKRHMVLMKEEDEFQPKHHLMMHLIAKIAFLGNPKCYATWADESENRRLKAMCRLTSQATFENSILTRFQIMARRVRQRRE